VALGSSCDSTRNPVQQLQQKIVGMPGRDLVRHEGLWRKILEVERQDVLGFCLNRGGQNMTVVRVG